MVRSFNATRKIDRAKLIDGLVAWSSVLEIKNISLRNYTTYTCVAAIPRILRCELHSWLTPAPESTSVSHVTTVTGSTATSRWVPPGWGTPPAGYTLLYRPKKKNGGKVHELNCFFVTGISFEQREDVTGADVTAAEIQGLTPGTVYEFLIQSHNAQGRSNYTSSSAQIPVSGVVKEVASSSSSNSQPGVPLLTLFLTSLTGAALLVLNVSIIVCFVKRFILKRNTSAAVSEAYGPVWTPGLDLETGRTGSIDSISSQVHYQFISQSPMGEEERRFSSTTHSLMTELSEYQKQEETPLTTIPTSDYFISTTSPLSNYRSDLINGGLNLAARKSQSSKSLTNFNEFMTPGESQHGLDDNIFRRMKVRVQSPDIPDVCPKSPTLCPSLTRLQSCERIVGQLEDNEDRISLSSNHSDSSYKGIQGQARGFRSHTPKSNVHQGNARCPAAIHKSERLTYSCHDIRREAIANKPCSGPSFSNICCSTKLTSQVIYHGQPHIQQQHEEEQKREHLQHLQHQNLQQRQMSQQHCPQLDHQRQSTENTPDRHQIIHQWPDHHYQERQQNVDHQNDPAHHHYHNQDQHCHLLHSEHHHVQQQHLGHHHHAAVSEAPDNHHQHRELNESLKFPERQPFNHREHDALCCPASETTMFHQTYPCCHQSQFHLRQPKYQEYQQLHNEHAQYLYLGHQVPAVPQQIFHSLPRKMRRYHSEDLESPKLHRVTHSTRSSTPQLYQHDGPPQSLSSNPITHSQSEHSYLTPSAQGDYQFHKDSVAEHSFSYKRETPVQYSRVQPSALTTRDMTYDNNGYGHFETTLDAYDRIARRHGQKTTTYIHFHSEHGNSTFGTDNYPQRHMGKFSVINPNLLSSWTSTHLLANSRIFANSFPHTDIESPQCCGKEDFGG
ncbi:uncharacterized protein LOC135209823 [Macrobrachium nipponense]|uniref:uncharacterized protein LOC135209823 n=1 Tax=Macrobrachium nipponense TaxID=159736 RepID=UPI0030C85ADF